MANGIKVRPSTIIIPRTIKATKVYPTKSLNSNPQTAINGTAKKGWTNAVKSPPNTKAITVCASGIPKACPAGIRKGASITHLLPPEGIK